jgi:Ion channel
VDALTFLAGIVLLTLVLADVFETVVVPRPSPGFHRLSRYLVRWTWRAWRWIGARTRTGLKRDEFYGLYAPGAVVLLLVAWMALLVVGFGLLFHALRNELEPVPQNLGTSLYFAGTSILTLGFGDVVANGALARMVSIVAAAAGLGLVALVITFLFSLYASYQRRESMVVTLSGRAGAPPSAVVLLEAHARLDLVDELPQLFGTWETWAAEVLDSHVAYPLLGYFRSSHDNVSWLSALGAVLDACALVLTTIEGVPRGQAELTKRGGAHLVEDISNTLSLRGDGSRVDRAEFDAVYERLRAAGYRLGDLDASWRRFERGRSTYAGRLEALAGYWAAPATVWIDERADDAAVAHATHEAPAGPRT